MRGARQLLTLRGPAEPRRGSALSDLGIIRDGALLIEDGRIKEVGLSRRVENLDQARRCQEIDATGRVVMPGFVDCHTHLVGGAPSMDGFEVRLAGSTGSPVPDEDVAPGDLRNESAKRLAARARQFVNGMVRHGTTTLAADSGYGLDESGEIKILRAYAKLNRDPLDVVPTYLAGEEAGSIPSDLLAAIERRGLARFVALRCGVGCDTERGRRYLESARNLGFQLKIHSSPEHAHEALRLALEMGAVSIDHLNHANSSEMTRLADSNTIAVLAPVRESNGASRNARALIDGGAAVALATHFRPGKRPGYSMQTVVALACEHLGLSPAEAICAATFNAAYAIGAGRVAGSLEVGKPADLIVLNASDYREIPYYFGVNLVNRTVKAGVTIYLEGKVAR